MKFFKLIGFSVLTVLSGLSAATSANDSESIEQEQGVVEAVAPPSINIEVEYDVLGKESEDSNEPLEFFAEDIVSLAYNVTNWEDTNVTIVGVTGTIVMYPQGYPVANITAANVGPYEMEVNGTSNFGQDVTLKLPEGQYFLVPFLLASKSEEMVRIAARPTLFEIVSPPISFFNPQFLSVQIILLAIVGGISYYYMKSKTQQRPTKKSVTDKRVDESWLPETYKK
ncbi:YEL001C [Saccharomyces arboricola H-6]|uniref:Increased recombination centers protein 22 n=1 Tax=Saccharomyces arboricola (strain H-6 / AS 2.3317 / CBS 10644) TaxID=1160507 RepID=J8PPG0_SACAR|nr:YEL001C [Saccharomyces arboricola H-6]